MKYIVIMFLFTTICFSQIAIVAAGNQTETIGEVFPIMQHDLKQKEVSLGIPKYEYPIEQPKPIQVKKKTFLQKLLESIKKLFN